MPRARENQALTAHMVLLLQFTSGAAVLLGLFAGVFFAWAYWGVGMDVGTVTRDLETATTTRIETADWDKTATLRHDEPPVEATPAEGELFAYIHVPHLGKTWKRAIQQGVSDRILASLGAGHYPQTAMPGQVGNSAYAGMTRPAISARSTICRRAVRSSSKARPTGMCTSDESSDHHRAGYERA